VIADHDPWFVLSFSSPSYPANFLESRYPKGEFRPPSLVVFVLFGFLKPFPDLDLSLLSFFLQFLDGIYVSEKTNVVKDTL